MDQFNNILSTLSVGQRIRITQTDGQSWEGTVVQNDKAEFLQLQVNMTTLVRYRAIDSLIVMDTAQGQAVPVSPKPLSPQRLYLLKRILIRKSFRSFRHCHPKKVYLLRK